MKKIKAPETLSPKALCVWNDTVKVNCTILKDVDSALLAAYCESVAIYQEAQVEYQKSGLVLQKDGKIIENPYLKILRREGANICKYAEQLCLTPASRAKRGINEQEPSALEKALAAVGKL